MHQSRWNTLYRWTPRWEPLFWYQYYFLSTHLLRCRFEQKVLFVVSLPRQCSDLNLPVDGAEHQKIGFKGIITLPKPINFKSTVKAHCQVELTVHDHILKLTDFFICCCHSAFLTTLFLTVFQDVSFMETFVFALRLQSLRCSALVLRLQIHTPKKRTVAQCVLSLRQLGPEETEHWLDLNTPSKSSVSRKIFVLTKKSSVKNNKCHSIY